jgi:hypothetical protein
MARIPLKESQDWNNCRTEKILGMKEMRDGKYPRTREILG